jgi:hypothetical protein
MKAYGGVDVYINFLYIYIYFFFLLVGEWSASCHSHFTSGERAPSTYWIGGWVGSRAGLDNMVKILDPTGTQNSKPLVIQPIASCYIDYAIPAPP